MFLKKGVAMKATISGLGAVLLPLALTTTTQAWFGFGSKCANCTPSADAASPGPSADAVSANGAYLHGDECRHHLFGKCLFHGGLFQGGLFHGGLFQGVGQPRVEGLGGPPFARSPRDYFMVDP
jgi:hypothetical protein